ncbi:gamma-glutamyl cyclotransferase [Salipiger aestuarii]|uniref:glutathione-specific gamma-glutamylcyclotransferase n=1 Tax=Salipiger aestuarii TaxID=568098 RepID=A0A327YMY6_9RHOB|nr:gamma-glutamylcyclotransferase [Salipiger aestuarii]EIE48916.1 cation transport protein [Citreicella sp. 357]KAA8610333.1 gamma-glutamyl cyclotransferase [Salipiger aestuarii]KAA8616349.1 gamma-glutamyl cyclotransferase [Salipiger aestuarii]KAB2543556.1 gamma-glutamyl cyclotransferase [Salipiger aestuarii]RAK21872.1 cation transport protein ChaC [Salipiger aestuarii]
MPLWVFGYGSLLWNPGFDVAEGVHAILPDYHRSFCMRSIHHRGSIAAPGLVLALDESPGALCKGLALRAAPGTEEATLAYLRERELVSSAYLEMRLRVDLRDGRRIEAVTYVIDPDHVQYCGGLPLEEQAEIIARASGGMGPNRQYLENTSAHLDQIGIPDAELHWLRDRVRDLTDNRLA